MGGAVNRPQGNLAGVTEEVPGRNGPRALTFPAGRDIAGAGPRAQEGHGPLAFPAYRAYGAGRDHVPTTPLPFPDSQGRVGKDPPGAPPAGAWPVRSTGSRLRLS